MKAEVKISAWLWLFQLCMALAWIKPANGQTQELSLLGLAFETESTSDSLERFSSFLNYMSHRRDPLWSYPDENSEALDALASAQVHTGTNPSSQYSGAQLQLGGGWRQSPTHYFSLQLGAHSLKTEDSSHLTSSSAIATYQGEVYLIPSETLSFSFAHKRDYVYQEMLQPAGTSDFLSAQTSSFRATWRLHEKLRILSRNTFRALSDANEVQNYDLAAMYGLATSENWIWIGLGGEARFSRETRVGYWSPRQFVSVGPRLEAAIPIQDKWSVSTGLNVNFSQENWADQSTGYYASAGGSYGKRDSRLFKLEGVLAQSLQAQSVWTSRGLRLSFFTSF